MHLRLNRNQAVRRITKPKCGVAGEINYFDTLCSGQTKKKVRKIQNLVVKISKFEKT